MFCRVERTLFYFTLGKLHIVSYGLGGVLVMILAVFFILWDLIPVWVKQLSLVSSKVEFELSLESWLLYHNKSRWHHSEFQIGLLDRFSFGIFCRELQFQPDFPHRQRRHLQFYDKKIKICFLNLFFEFFQK